jgi:transposase
MVTIGVDPHKKTHSAVAVDAVGARLDARTEPAKLDGFAALWGWARRLPDRGRVWVIEDCRHVCGPLERLLVDHGETVVGLAPGLMAGARHSVRERGKSDPIAALAVARAALREGIDRLPAARLVGVELEIRQLAVHRQRLVDAHCATDQRPALAAARPVARVEESPPACSSAPAANTRSPGA